MGPGDDAETTTADVDVEDVDVEPTYEGTEGDGGLYAGGLPMGDG